jgi:hypothetical protein
MRPRAGEPTLASNAKQNVIGGVSPTSMRIASNLKIASESESSRNLLGSPSAASKPLPVSAVPIVESREDEIPLSGRRTTVSVSFLLENATLRSNFGVTTQRTIPVLFTIMIATFSTCWFSEREG